MKDTPPKPAKIVSGPGKDYVPFMRDVFTIPSSVREKPRLIGSVCPECEEYFFPKTGANLSCDNPFCPRSTKETFLSGKGKILSATVTRASINGGGERASAVILLEEGIKINSHLVGWEGFRDMLVPGSPVELVLEERERTESGKIVVGYAFQLVTGRRKPKFPPPPGEAPAEKPGKDTPSKEERLARAIEKKRLAAEKKRIDEEKRKAAAERKRAAAERKKAALAKKKALLAKKRAAAKKKAALAKKRAALKKQQAAKRRAAAKKKALLAKKRAAAKKKAALARKQAALKKQRAAKNRAAAKKKAAKRKSAARKKRPPKGRSRPAPKKKTVRKKTAPKRRTGKKSVRRPARRKTR